MEFYHHNVSSLNKLLKCKSCNNMFINQRNELELLTRSIICHACDTKFPWKSRKNKKAREIGVLRVGGGTLVSWSSILVPGRPTLHLLSPSAAHQKGIYRVQWLRAPSLVSIIICASGAGQNWPCINKQKGRRTANKQRIRNNQWRQKNWNPKWR